MWQQSTNVKDFDAGNLCRRLCSRIILLWHHMLYFCVHVIRHLYHFYSYRYDYIFVEKCNSYFCPASGVFLTLSVGDIYLKSE